MIFQKRKNIGLLEKMGHMTYVIDFDGTICLEKEKPNTPLIEKINSLFDGGDTILINSSAAWRRYGQITGWLKENQVKYHDLILGRPWGDFYVDDKMLSLKEFTEMI